MWIMSAISFSASLKRILAIFTDLILMIPRAKGKLRSITDLPRHLSAAISRVKINPETGEPTEIVLANKTEASATLLRSLPGGSIERHEHSGRDGVPLPVPIINLLGKPVELLCDGNIVADKTSPEPRTDIDTPAASD